MTYSFVQTPANAFSGFISGGSSLTVTYGTATTAGTLLIALAGGYNGGVSTYSMPAGWVSLGPLQKDSNAGCLQIFAYPNNPGGITSVAITQDANGQAQHTLFELSNTGGTLYVDTIQLGTAAATTAFSQVSKTPFQAGEMILTLGAVFATPSVTETAYGSGGSGTETPGGRNTTEFWQWDTIAGSAAVTPTATFGSSQTCAYAVLTLYTPYSADWVLLQSASTSSNAAPANPTWTISQVGSLLLMYVSVYDAGVTFTTPSGWTLWGPGIVSDGLLRFAFYYYLNNPGGIASAANIVGGTSAGTIIFMEFLNSTNQTTATTDIQASSTSGATLTESGAGTDELCIVGACYGNTASAGDATWPLTLAASSNTYEVGRTSWKITTTPTYTDATGGSLGLAMISFAQPAVTPFPLGFERTDEPVRSILLRM